MPINPAELDPAFNETWEPGSGFTLVDEGIYWANIFAVEPKTSQKDGSKSYQIEFRLVGGQYDDERIKVMHAGLYPKAIFVLHGILVGIGEIDRYYDAANRKWMALPAPDDLIGKGTWVQVQHREFAQTKNGQYVPNPADPSGINWLKAAEITAYGIGQQAPEFKPVKIERPPLKNLGQPAIQGLGAPGAPMGALPMAGAGVAAPAQAAWQQPQQAPAPQQAPMGGGDVWNQPTPPGLAQQPQQQAPAQGQWQQPVGQPAPQPQQTPVAQPQQAPVNPMGGQNAQPPAATQLPWGQQ